jgi:DNA-binding response OmpR family regulator
VGRILFVDDDTDALEMYIKAVSLADHKADVASGSLEGWELVKKNKYDLVFVDLNIPGISGFELIEKLAKDRRSKDIPVIVISAMPEHTQVQEVLKAGANLFLEKPIALVDLLEVIKKFEEKSSASLQNQ